MALFRINVRYRLANRLPLQAVQSASWQVQLLGVEKPEVRDHQRFGGGSAHE
jgi:hypothetical protein